MNTPDVAITTAKINAIQAIVVALITGVLTLLTTLFATGVFSTAQGTGASGGSGSPSVLDAPQIAFHAQPNSMSLQECAQKARETLKRTDFTGIQERGFYAFGYSKDRLGFIWCHSDARQLIFLGAAKDENAAVNARDLLVRSF